MGNDNITGNVCRILMMWLLVGNLKKCWYRLGWP